MWPMLLSMTREECRLTLRRMELEAYSNVISVFRAQGALQENRKKLLEDLRGVLHISNDRHSVEARRVSNDELLATIAEKLSGPNTGIGWVCEGRRRVPLLLRGVPQTMYTEIADKAAEAAAAENKELIKRLETGKVVHKSNEEEMPIVGNQIVETCTTNANEASRVPVAIEDPTIKMWETELTNQRKRKIPDDSTVVDEGTTPIKNMRNISINTNQKHVNLSQIYAKLSQPAPTEHIRGKHAGQSKHSYNQVSKVSTSKSNQLQGSRSSQKPRAHKAKTAKAQKKLDPVISPSKPYNPLSLQHEYSGPPNTFQATYAQSLISNKSKIDYTDDKKSKSLSSPSLVSDSPTRQILTQPAIVPHELEVAQNTHHAESPLLQAQSVPVKQTFMGKQHELLIKHSGDVTIDRKLQSGELKLLQKPSENIKILSNRQLIVASRSSQKILPSPSKLVTTKVIGSLPKSRSLHTPVSGEKLSVVSKSLSDNRVPKSVTSISSTPTKDSSYVTVNSVYQKNIETLTPKGIPATDLKVSAKAVVLNPKSAQKVVILPAKSRSTPGSEGQIPVLHFKGISTPMKLIPVSSQSMTHIGKSPAMTVISKPVSSSNVSTSAKKMGIETIKTANLADIVPVKGLAPVTTSKITNPIVRTSNTKGNVIVVQKGTTLGKALTFAKGNNDMSKIIMGKNVNQLLQASKTEQTESGKCPGNVIVLELNNDQPGRPTTMSEILDSRNTTARVTDDSKKVPQITQDTPVLFENQMAEERDSSLHSRIGNVTGINAIDTDLPIIGNKEDKTSYVKEDVAKGSPSVTDWEMELETVSRKNKDDDKLNSLHLDLGMSSDSEAEYMTSHSSKAKHSPRESIQHVTSSGESGEMYRGSSGMSLATRTLLSQLQDDGSSSNDSSFALKTKIGKFKEVDTKIDKSESDALTKAKEKLSEKVADAISQQKRIDIYSTAITPTEINLESFSYLDEGMIGDDVFASEESKLRESQRSDTLDDQLSRLLGDDSANSTDLQTVGENSSLNK